ncbi:hydroxymethylglutaryl-CoA lyase [Clostridium sp.]|uniref:hydroxymethylglutaryl-CoA lyase n=1 Tax=Clostridium sp. TaxID=1506 RepID=UPI001A59C9BF|nr:hydroxymethylglutaryl-CoA lyase [Clostridium sp.]MBK5241489.1 hydroxymethylglutaryl-CoA lyase [Clostridium sp.]
MSCPKKINIVEVGPRDGFQSIEHWISTELKLEVIDELVKSNIKKIEFTSFVSPKAIEQMKDAKVIAETVIKKYKDIEFIALIPNLFGAKAAWNAGIKEIAYVISASESHNMANVKRTIEQSFEELVTLKKELPDMKIKVDIATAFGCPFEGDVTVEQIKKMIDKCLALNIDDICLCDTIGIANPVQMKNVLSELNQTYPRLEYSLHLHDTRGMGLANVLVALECGVTTFETAVGGIGGCPFAPGAAGNTSSEDMVNMLISMGIDTGINLEQLVKTAKLIEEKIKPNLTGRIVHIGSCSV